MKRFGIVSYNIYCNFTNYGSALQSWALSHAIDRIGGGRWESVIVDYCPDCLADKDPLHPFENMWDQDEESKRMCELTMPAIRENYAKFNCFYNSRIKKTRKKYTRQNFGQLIPDERLDGFVCGSDTIFCIDEFNGFDDGYFANYDCMKKGYSVSYAASFGDAHFDEESLVVLKQRLQNFKFIGLRESAMIPYVQNHVLTEVRKNIDPTLLLTSAEYDSIAYPRLVKEKYLLLYARRYNPEMEALADEIAEKNGWTIVEISLRAVNRDKHIMRYDAGVEEFLSLVKNAEFVLTNSFHGLIFSVQYGKPFFVFSRESGDSKISEVLELFGLQNRLLTENKHWNGQEINYAKVHNRITEARQDSLDFLNRALEGCK